MHNEKALVIIGSGNRIAAPAGYLMRHMPANYKHVYASGLGGVLGYLALKGDYFRIEKFIAQLSDRNFYGKDLLNDSGQIRLRYQMQEKLNLSEHLCTHRALRQLISEFYDSRENWDMFLHDRDITLEVFNLSDGTSETKNANSRNYFHFKDYLVATACPAAMMQPITVGGKQYAEPIYGQSSLLEKAIEDGHRELDVFLPSTFWQEGYEGSILPGSEFSSYEQEVYKTRIGHDLVLRAKRLAEETGTRMQVRFFPSMTYHFDADFDVDLNLWALRFSQTGSLPSIKI